MYKVVLFATLAILGNLAQAADLFEDGKAREMPYRTPLQANDTIGGYTLYPGEGKWSFEKATTNTATGAGAIPLGTVIAKQDEDGVLFARIFATVNLGQGESSFWLGTPCSLDHLVVRNQGRGRDDHCMTIDPINIDTGGKLTTLLSIRLTHSASGGRYYVTTLQLNPALLGIRDSGYGDWTVDVIASHPYKEDFLRRLTAWAEKLQDASTAAFAYSKPKDAFKDIPSWRTLLQVSDELTQKKLTWTFLSVIEDVKNNKPGFKALAYTQSGTTWGGSWRQLSQAQADKTALANCEKNRWEGAPECALLPLE